MKQSTLCLALLLSATLVVQSTTIEELLQQTKPNKYPVEELPEIVSQFYAVSDSNESQNLDQQVDSMLHSILLKKVRSTPNKANSTFYRTQTKKHNFNTSIYANYTQPNNTYYSNQTNSTYPQNNTRFNSFVIHKNTSNNTNNTYPAYSQPFSNFIFYTNQSNRTNSSHPTYNQTYDVIMSANTTNNMSYPYNNQTTYPYNNQTINNQTYPYNNQTYYNQSYPYNNQTINNQTYPYNNQTINNQTYPYNNQSYPLNNQTYPMNNQTQNYTYVQSNGTVYGIFNATNVLNYLRTLKNGAKVYNYYNATNGLNETFVIYNNSYSNFSQTNYSSYFVANETLFMVEKTTADSGEKMTNVFYNTSLVTIGTYNYTSEYTQTNNYYNSKQSQFTFIDTNNTHSTSGSYNFNNGNSQTEYDNYSNSTNDYSNNYYSNQYYNNTQGTYYNNHIDNKFNSQNTTEGVVIQNSDQWGQGNGNSTIYGFNQGFQNKYNVSNHAKYDNGQQINVQDTKADGVVIANTYSNASYGPNGTFGYMTDDHSNTGTYFISEQNFFKDNSTQSNQQSNQFFNTYQLNQTFDGADTNETSVGYNNFTNFKNYTSTYPTQDTQFLINTTGANYTTSQVNQNYLNNQSQIRSGEIQNLQQNNYTQIDNKQMNSSYANTTKGNLFNNTNSNIYKLNNSTFGTTNSSYNFGMQYNSYQFENGQNNTQTGNTQFEDTSSDIIRNNLARSMFFMTKGKRQSGGWQEMNVQEVLQSNTEIVSEAIAEVNEKFAPREEGYEFDEIISIHEQIVAGFNYNIKLRYANEQGQTQDYQVFIYSAPWTRQPDQIVSCEQLN